MRLIGAIPLERNDEEAVQPGNHRGCIRAYQPLGI
ncbi:hypothetical protein NK6_8109 [Bradyrhizobium diazoefficiens]|uniref:Uncharacterized protein n=1 Tax=Bradyrhizobium diazoefficiens TaxID=1355477 RepID=A0A0E4G0U2_9BRAD|nr:hypothetical protein NK6_8109 [Bradyrhizobium diazoefficiens]